MVHPKDFLQDFKSYLHADGYAGYHGLPEDITVVGCWAHVRRKFDEALKSIPEKSRAGSLAEKGMKYCNRLFVLEGQYEELSAEERLKRRKEKSLPILKDFFNWAHSFDEIGKSAASEMLFVMCWNRSAIFARIFWMAVWKSATTGPSEA